MIESLRTELIQLRKPATAGAERATERERDAALDRTIRCCEIIRRLEELAARN